MTRYIDADTLYVNVKAECNPYGKPTIGFDDGCKVLDMIRRTPTADVVPVVHAHWEITKLTAKWIFVCSHCRCGWYESYEGEDIAWKYCPDCGALMDEEAG